MQNTMPTTEVSPHQHSLNDFQIKCMEMFHTNKDVRQLLKETIKANQPFNGVMTITQTTKNYIKYMRSYGVKLDKGKPLLTYMPFDQFMKTNQNQLGRDVLLVLQKYTHYTPEEKEQKFLFIFQVPFADKPEKSLKNMAIIEIDLTSL